MVMFSRSSRGRSEIILSSTPLNMGRMNVEEEEEGEREEEERKVEEDEGDVKNEKNKDDDGNDNDNDNNDDDCYNDEDRAESSRVRAPMIVQVSQYCKMHTSRSIPEGYCSTYCSVLTSP